MRLIIRNNNIYGLGVGIRTVRKILRLKWTGGGGAYPWGTPGLCHWMRLIISNNNLYGFGVGIWSVFELLCLIWNGGGGDLKGFWDNRHFMKWGGGGHVHWGPFENSCKTSYPYLSYPQISEQSAQWLLGNYPDKFSAHFGIPLGDLMSPSGHNSRLFNSMVSKNMPCKSSIYTLIIYAKVHNNPLKTEEVFAP